MKRKTNFSIIMPVYNGKETLAKTIQSILDQSYKNYELIIVDDHSTDGSYKIAKNYASKNKKIRLYRVKINKGAPFCMNFGTNKAKYEWLGIADSDIIAPKDWLEKANDYTQKNLDLFGGKYVFLSKTFKKGYFIKIFYYFEQMLCPDKDIVYNKNNFSEPLLAGGGFFYKKRLFRDVGEFDTTIRAGYDVLFFSLAVEQGFMVKYIPRLFVYHPLYDYHNLKNFLKRHILFTQWRMLLIKKCRLLDKPYRLGTKIIFSLLICILISYSLFGLIVTAASTITICTSILLINSLNLFLKDKIPLKYIPGYIILDFIKKSITLAIYLLKLKPNTSDWKQR